MDYDCLFNFKNIINFKCRGVELGYGEVSGVSVGGGGGGSWYGLVIANNNKEIKDCEKCIIDIQKRSVSF